jgi:succinate dehydrogenase/fumarate reductase flavoprotein subunit
MSQRNWQQIAKAELVVGAVREELDRAMTRHAPMNSAHEGYSVILEELDELWDEIKKRRAARDDQAMRTEALQIAAMACRFVLDVLPHTEGLRLRPRRRKS